MQVLQHPVVEPPHTSIIVSDVSFTWQRWKPKCHWQVATGFGNFDELDPQSTLVVGQVGFDCEASRSRLPDEVVVGEHLQEVLVSYGPVLKKCNLAHGKHSGDLTANQTRSTRTRERGQEAGERCAMERTRESRLLPRGSRHLSHRASRLLGCAQACLPRLPAVASPQARRVGTETTARPASTAAPAAAEDAHDAP